MYYKIKSMQKEVIRIEHPNDGSGVWNSIDIIGYMVIKKHSNFCDISDRHYNKNKFPNFTEDMELNCQISYEDVQDYHFAFKNLEQLESGFTNDELKELINILGFKVYTYTVVDYFESEFQVVFKKISSSDKKDISFLFI